MDILSTIVTVVGFIITIVTILKIKKVATIAKLASEDTVRKLTYIDIVKELAAAIEVAEVIKTLIVTESWHLLPDRFAIFKSRIIKIRHNDNEIIEAHIKDLQPIIGQTVTAEKSIIKSIGSGESIPKKIDMLRNRIVDQSTMLQEIQGRVSNAKVTDIKQEVTNEQ